jgi:hypothetical protein
MKHQRLSLEDKKDLVGKVDELVKSENVSVKEACSRLDTPYWKYFNALKTIKNGKKKAKTGAKTLVVAPVNDDLKMELVFKGDIAKLVMEYAEAYCVEPEVVCKIIVIDALKER